MPDGESAVISGSERADRRFSYGYVMVGVSTVGFIATTPGQTVIVSQFNTSLRDAFSIDESQLSYLYMAATILAALPLTLVGRFSDRFGTRLAMGLAAAALAITCLAMGFIEGPLSLLAGFFCLRFFGQGSLSLVSAHALAMWFDKRLAAMESIRFTFFQLANAALPMATILLIEGVGWRSAYPILGACVAASVLPMVLFLFRNRPEDIGQRIDGGHLVLEAVSPESAEGDEPDAAEPVAPGEPDFTLREALATRAYSVLAGAVILSPMIGTALIFHLQPIAATVGLDEKGAAAMQSVFWITSMVGVMVLGRFADRFHAGRSLSLAVGLMVVACALVALARTGLALGAALAVYGVGTALAILVAHPTLARYFGRTHHGAIRGLMTTCLVVSTAVGPVIAGEAISRFGDHRWAFWAFAAVSIPLALTALTLRPPAPPRRTRGPTGPEKRSPGPAGG